MPSSGLGGGVSHAHFLAGRKHRNIDFAFCFQHLLECPSFVSRCTGGGRGCGPGLLSESPSWSRGGSAVLGLRFPGPSYAPAGPWGSGTAQSAYLQAQREPCLLPLLPTDPQTQKNTGQ